MSDISPVSKEALESYRELSHDIIKESVLRSLKISDNVIHHGDQAERMLTVGFEFTARILDAVMSIGELSLLEDQLFWAKDRLPHEGVMMEHVLDNFKIYKDVVNEILPNEHAIEINCYLDWMISLQKELTQNTKI